MMRKPLSAFVLCSTLAACGSQQPAAAPLAAPPPAEPAPVAVTPPTVEAPKEAPKPVEPTQDQIAKIYQGCWGAFNAKDWTKFSSCFADNATSERVDQDIPVLTGKDITPKGIQPFATAFPDITGEAQLTLVSGSNVVGVWLLRGNHKAPLLRPNGEIPASDKKVGYLMGHVVEMKAGQVTREAAFYDARTLLSQLGAVPGPARKAQEQGAAEKPVVFATNSDAEKANVATYKLYAEAFGKKEAAGFEALLADDFVYSDQSMPADLVGKKETMKSVKEAWKGMTDAKITVATSWGAGDFVASTGLFEGTNDGPLPAMKLWKKTGKRVSVNFLSIAKLQGGKLKQEWVFTNGLRMADQLGVAPAIKTKAPADPAKAKPAAAATPATPAAPGAAGKAATPAAPKAATPATPAAPKAATPATPATPAAPKAAAPAPAAPKAQAPATPAPAAPAKPAAPPAAK